MAPAEEAESPQEALPGPGERLRSAREAQGYSFDDVVRELHLEPEVVSAIERDDLDGLSAPVFVRGYLRSYAKLVGLPEQEVVDAWQPTEQDPEEFRTVSTQRELKMGASLSMFVLWGLLGLLVIAAFVYLFAGSEGDEPTEAVAQQTVSPAPAAAPLREDFVVQEPLTQPSEPEATPVEVDVPVENDVSAPSDPVSATAAPPDDQTAGSATELDAIATDAADEVTVADELELVVSFSAECWIELSANGRRLLYGLEKPGSVKRFPLQPPLRFFVGDADAVNISIGGREYPIPRSVRTGRNTARFVLDTADIEGLQ